MTFTVAAFYKFTPLEPSVHRDEILRVAGSVAVRGSILLAPEGVNGTIAGKPAAIDTVIAHLRTLPGCRDLEWKKSTAARQPFRRLKVRLKREIVTLGEPADPNERVGTYVAPGDWNDVLSDPDTVTIDTRNAYETAIGTFEGAIDPGTESFGDFPRWWAKNQDMFAGKRVAMFCTGGIRCEKASSWLLAQGVPEVLHLKGGILKYLEETPAVESAWSGECYVFDERVAVGHGLTQGSHTMCHACGRPVAAVDHTHPAYRKGVSCPVCIDEFTDEDRARFAMRQAQIDREIS